MARGFSALLSRSAMPCLVFDQAAAGVTSCPTAQTKPASSRATAITALFVPIRPTRLRYRWWSRAWARRSSSALPDPVARALDARVDDRLLFEIDPAEPGVVRLRVLPRDFAGSMTGVFGTTDETLAFVRGERDAWGE